MVLTEHGLNKVAESANALATIFHWVESGVVNSELILGQFDTICTGVVLSGVTG